MLDSPNTMNSHTHLNHRGKISQFLNFFLPSLAILLEQFLELHFYINYPIEDKYFLFLSWIISGLIGSVLVGFISDIYGRKKTLVATQLCGFFGILLLIFFGLNIWILNLLALVYNPLSVARAALIDDFHAFTERVVLAVTVILQALPWSFYLLIQSQPSNFFLIALSLCVLCVSLFTILFFNDLRKTTFKNENSHSRSNKINISKTLLAFLFAEMVYFITAITTDTAADVNRGKLFLIIGISVSLGASIHLIIQTWHAASFNHTISAIYALGTIFLGLGLLTTLIIPSANFFLSFISMISCLGGLYIVLPLESHPKPLLIKSLLMYDALHAFTEAVDWRRKI